MAGGATETRKRGTRRSASRLDAGTVEWSLDGTGSEMARSLILVVYVVAMAAIIVASDVIFFRSRFWERLIFNVGIVLVFVAFYFRYLRRP